MRKTLYAFAFASLSSFMFGQVAIGKQAVTGTTTILDFDNAAGNTKGIILPAVESINNALAATVTDNNGTFLFDKSDKKVKMYENSQWVALSDTGAVTTALAANSNTSSENGKGVIIGANTTPAKGVLVLEGATKAMILPQVANPHTSVKSPYPGMMCYDTVSKTIAVFDGVNWNYWK
ncbi:hypothetical protein [Chryseobacterium sp.]|uniref:hypothetical protein n=1 Tax=Chryseobacterium sp. TaxID=1871047 RepID=UPI0024E25572|nr:hypothetical protein [Chryseobacterium sp.]